MMKKKPPTKFSHKKDQSVCCSPIIIVSWILVILWTLFIVYCWYFGLVNEKKVERLIENVDIFLNKTEETFIKGEKTLLRGGDVGVAPLKQLQQSITTSAETEVSSSEDDVYVIFSTDCSPYQDWQTLVLFHSAKIAQQKGAVIRIASGCTEEKQQQLTELYQQLYGKKYYAHFTPDFKHDAKTNRKYDFYNKPWGLKHFLELANPPLPEDALIALLDPDMILLRPITPFIGSRPFIIDKHIPRHEIVNRIGDGHPAAQTYGLGAPWTNDTHRHFKRSVICGEDSPCLEPDRVFGELHYSVGPPYVVTKRDFIKIANSWTRLVPRVYEGYPYLLAEMYAYSMAAAHERLPHLQVDHYMVSNVDSGGEGWAWIDALEENVCSRFDGHTHFPNRDLPTVLHFCQTYRVGDLSYTKRRVPHDLFSCESPLFVEVNPELTSSTYIIKNGKKEKPKSQRNAKRNAFMLCTAYQAINAALVDFKQHMCAANTANYEKSLKL